jgi:hypothetical protein
MSLIPELAKFIRNRYGEDLTDEEVLKKANNIEFSNKVKIKMDRYMFRKR